VKAAATLAVSRVCGISATTRLTPFDISTILETWITRYAGSPMSALPAQISISLAAKLSGRSRVGFHRDVLACVQIADGRAVDRFALEAHIGRRFSADEYLAADHALAGQRRRQTEYRARERGYKQGNPATQEMNLKAPSDGGRSIAAS
jgi:hypothetical protein